VDAAGVEFDDEQNVEPAHQDGVEVGEVARQHRLGLRGAELAPARACPPRTGADAGGLQDVPHRGRADLDANAGELAVYAPVSPARVLPGEAQHQSLDRGRGRWPAGPAARRRIGPLPPDDPAMPAQQRGRGEDPVIEQVTREQPAQCRQHDAVGGL